MEGTAVSEIVHFNDNQDYAGPVRATIKRAQKLYDGLYRVWELEKRYSAVMAQRAKDFAKLKL
jgi:hypothetical protein